MYLDTHVIASVVLIGSMIVLTGVGVKLLRQAIKRDADAAR